MKVGLFVGSLCQAMLEDHVGGEEIIRELSGAATQIAGKMGVSYWAHGASAGLKEFAKPESIQEMNAHLQAFKGNILNVGVDPDFFNSLLLSEVVKQATINGVTFEQWMDLCKTSFEKVKSEAAE